MKITLGWWNTNLTPVAKKQSKTYEDRPLALQVVHDLLQNRQVSILALCEVSIEDMAFFKSQLGDLYECPCFGEKFGHTQYDLGIIYRNDVIKFINKTYIKHHDEKSIYGLGVKVTLNIDGNDFIFIISHWPSRRFKPHKSEDRTVYGISLRNQIKDSKLGNTPIILAGDYNDEPFDAPLASGLKATRDRSRSLSYDYVFYNPFWRKIGEHRATRGKDKTSGAGTYYYRSGKETKWYNFDSMIFSKHLLGRRGWRLAEDRVEIVTTDLLFNLVYSNQHGFDHLPLTAVIEN